MQNILSEKEQKLYDFIKKNVKDATIDAITKELGKEYIGAIGKLISKKLIKKDKKRGNAPIVNTSTYVNLHSTKYIKFYSVVEKEGS